MYGPDVILDWIEREVKPMRRSRQKTLAVIVAAAMRMRGLGVLALGRAVESQTTAKHAIKRVWRFFRNERLEVTSIQQALVNQLLPGQGRPVVVLVDWTEDGDYKTLVAALPRDGRAVPIYWQTILRKSGEGAQKAAEQTCLAQLKDLFVFVSEVVLVADRGFGNTRWLADVRKWGWGYVQRLAGSLYVENEQYYRALADLPIFRGELSKDWGVMALTQEEPVTGRLVTVRKADASEPWYLLTSRTDIPPEIVLIYQRRMWIEEMFRDLKNRSCCPESFTTVRKRTTERLHGLGVAGVAAIRTARPDRGRGRKPSIARDNSLFRTGSIWHHSPVRERTRHPLLTDWHSRETRMHRHLSVRALTTLLATLLLHACSAGVTPQDGDTGIDGDTDGAVDGDRDPADGDLDPDGDDDQAGRCLSVPAVISFGAVLYGDRVTRDVEVANTCDFAIELTTVEVDRGSSGDFSVENLPPLRTDIPAGLSHTLRVVYEPSDAGIDWALIKIYSTDPVAPVINVELISAYKGEASIEVSPADRLDFLEVERLAEKVLPVVVRNRRINQDDNVLLEVSEIRIDTGFNAQFSLRDLPRTPFFLIPGGETRFEIAFHPQDIRAYEAVLHVINDDPDPDQRDYQVALTGAGVVPRLSISPLTGQGAVDLGPVKVGLRASQTVVLENAGGAVLRIESARLQPGGSADLTLDLLDHIPATLGPGDETTLRIDYAPNRAEADTAVLEIVSNSYEERTRLVPVTGLGVVSALTPDPASLEFGAVRAGQNAGRTITFTNAGVAPVTVTGLAITAGSASFTIVDPTPLAGATLLPGPGIEIGLSFAPVDEGEATGTLTVESDDNAAPLLAVQLHGAGVASKIAFDRTDGRPFDGTLDFGLVRLGESAPAGLRVRSTGSAPLTIASLEVADGSDVFSLQPPGVIPAIPPGQFLDLSLVYTPDTPAAFGGPDTGTLEVVSDAWRQQTVTAALAGSCIDPHLTVSPGIDEHDFGSILMGATRSKDFTLTNTGSGPLTVSAVSFPERTVAFAVAGIDRFPFDLNGAESRDFSVRFTPPADGPYQAELTIESSDLARPEVTIAFRGTGLPCPPCRWNRDDNPDDCEYECCITEEGVELCDGKDNDCNGGVDDAPDVARNCPAPPDARAVCRDGECDFECLPPFHRCGGGCAPPDDPDRCGPGCTVCPEDALPCTDRTCKDDLCGFAVATGWCLIDAACWRYNQTDPTESCRVCDPFRSSSDWTGLDDGEACEDGLFCTTGEECSGGRCQGGEERDCRGSLTEPECQTPVCTNDPAGCRADPANEGSDCDDGGAGDGWHQTGDLGPGCLAMDDPAGERRDYACRAGACRPSVLERVECDGSDGWYGGGDTPGCGPDPVSVERDYFAGSDGLCTFTLQACRTKQCDDQDVCGLVCDGSTVREWRDGYVQSGSGSCALVFGPALDDCLGRASVDTDGSPVAYTVGGTVTDYTGCSGGSCASVGYSDACTAQSVLSEYGALGAGISGPDTFDCQSLETDFCTQSRYRYRNEWICMGTPGFCADSGIDSLVADCGIDGCAGTCGAAPSGCAWHRRGCQEGACLDEAQNPDLDRAWCLGCGQSWAIGGETAPDGCCGDDAGEFARSCSDSSANGDCGPDALACCNAASDCVDHLGLCAEAGGCRPFGASGARSFCSSGIWEDPDDDAAYCTAPGCGYVWLAGAPGNRCCGDDAGEDAEQPQGDSGRACCYNGSPLGSGDSSGPILCHNGELYDCQGFGGDDSGLGLFVPACGGAGSRWCTAAGQWAAGKEAACPCAADVECATGHCKYDYDGTGAWCAGAMQCMHNAVAHESGAHSFECWDGDGRAACISGTWIYAGCGTDSACAQHGCLAGDCTHAYQPSTTLCNPAWACSSGPGDDRYGTAGQQRCRGYCDGAGGCDLAADCTDCNAQDGWYGTGDGGPGCTTPDDPSGQRRDYSCGGGECGFVVAETLDCDHQDGWYGGGDTPGCGDDLAAEQRDYYVSPSGICVYTLQNCGSADCDAQDACTGTCDGSIVRGWADAYVLPGTGSCTLAFGSAGEDCATKPGIDSDGSPTNYAEGGSVTDYTGCSGGACTAVTFADTCVNQTSLREYGVNGAVVSQTTYDCQSGERDFCQDGRYRWHDEIVCTGSPGFCADTGADTYLGDCGTSGCNGTCGVGANGCRWQARGCSDGSCFASDNDADSGEPFCAGCGLSWAIGGEVAPAACCGDDGGESVRACVDSSQNGSCGSDTNACCSAGSDCVDHLGQCADAGRCTAFGTAGAKSYCSAGVWEDPDEDMDWCAADGCGYVWLAGGIGERCCGDDAGEEIEQGEVAGRACCYNGQALASGSASGSILCQDGQLYDCTGIATDDSGLATHVAACGSAGILWCGASGQWSAGKERACPCETNGQCASNHCSHDYDGTGAWCANQTECAHDATMYADNAVSAGCWDVGGQARCTSGAWQYATCGTDTACTDNTCSAGVCLPLHAPTTQGCNSAPACSSGPGDNGYSAGGDYACTGFCDGSGNCDFAGNCTACSASDGWYGTGDNGPGCLVMNDPTAQYRDYSCSAGTCTPALGGTRDCDTSDGWYGGGDTPGCGNDPDGTQLDFYVGSGGACTYTIQNCGTKDCDGLDSCGPTCDGTLLKGYRDSYVTSGTQDCATTWGGLVEDCSLKASSDSDGSPTAFTTAGTVTDYTGCSGSACSGTTYADTCASGTMLTEYGASGTGVVSQTHNCENFESIVCETNRYRRKQEWACMGAPSFCGFTGTTTTVQDCGVSGCTGTCGSGTDGCTWHERGCPSTECYDNAFNPDDGQTYCTGCGLGWLASASGNRCCGDDQGEDNEQPGSGRSCCYNGAVLASGTASGSILCNDGELFDCNGSALDDSGLGTHVTTCNESSGYYCRSNNTWGTGKENSCACNNSTECASGWCKNDYDGSGAWCANQTQCAHNAVVYNSSSFSVDCFTTEDRALCNSGSWQLSSCGADTACTNYSCSAGVCGTQQYGSSTRCDTTWRCASGSGDGRYNQTGSYRCQGYCDGSGNCDFAGACNNCADDFANATGTCAADSCAIASCNNHYVNCDGNTGNGCEEWLGYDAAPLNSCGDNYLGSVCGDEGSDTRSASARGSRWYKVTVEECVSDPFDWPDIDVKVTLTVPSGIDYDLFSYWDSCGSSDWALSNLTGNGISECIGWSVGDFPSLNDDYDVFILVYHYSGESCSNWNLTAWGNKFSCAKKASFPAADTSVPTGECRTDLAGCASEWDVEFDAPEVRLVPVGGPWEQPQSRPPQSSSAAE